MTLDVLTMGRSLVDLYPREDGPLENVTGYDQAVGGSPTNVAIAATRLGRRAGVISRVGDDPLGRFVIAALAELGVDTSQVRAATGRTTAVAICEISPPDHFPLTIYRPEPAADMAIDPDSLDLDAVGSAGIFWTSMSGLAAEPSRAAHHRALRARSGSGHTVLDLDYRPAFWPDAAAATDAVAEVLALATIVIGNLEECRIALGATGADHAADEILARGAKLAIVKLGGDGVLVRTASESVQLAAVPVTVANGLGAGDAFGGALCHGILAGWPLERVVGFANAAGAIVASRRGCSTAMPTEAEVAALV